MKTIFAENKYLRKSILIFRKYFSEPFIRAVNSIIKQESNAVRLIRPADKFISEKIIPIITEPVNIISLIVRKIYNDNIQITLTYTTALIVVFYIILSIF
ncbi:MAG: hypothetical protein IT280_06125 [Ignavibacteria bacterium]|nr:hypothetical protein [Ignavibacteria bacterium]